MIFSPAAAPGAPVKMNTMVMFYSSNHIKPAFILYKDAVFDTNENPCPRRAEAQNIKKSRAFTVLPVHSAEL